MVDVNQEIGSFTSCRIACLKKDLSKIFKSGSSLILGGWQLEYTMGFRGEFMYLP